MYTVNLKNKSVFFQTLTGLLFLILRITNCLSETIDVDIKSYKTDKQYESTVSAMSANNKQYIIGQGDASFDFTSQTQGWYELWVDGANWDTKIELDGKLLAYSNLVPLGTNTKTDLRKIANLYLNAGSHHLRFERIQFPGLPYLSGIKIIAATQMQGKLSLVPVKDYFAFKLNEAFPLKLTIAKDKTINKLQLDMVDVLGVIQKSSVIDIPTGIGNYETTLQAPTTKEGAFVLKARVNNAALSAIEMDYAVIDTQAKFNQCTATNAQPRKELVFEIDPTKTQPDYYSELPNITTNQNLVYLESGNKGVYQNTENPSYFAYKIKVPTVADNYLIEIDYPEDKSRTFTVSVVENDSTPYQIDSGVTMGYFYPLSGETRNHQISFFPRIKEPRLLFINWDSAGRIALQKIRLYKIKLPQCKNITPTNSTRSFAYFFEENLRYPAYFGGKNNSWADLIKTTERWANWSGNMGVNHWVQAIASYRTKMWPSEKLPGYAMTYNDGTSFYSDFLQHDPAPKDIFRLMLLLGEKYGIKVNGELQLAIDKPIEKTFASFTKDKNQSYLIQDKNQLPPKEFGTPYQAYLNPTHPDVVNWVSSIFSELEGRYNSYAAFDGLTMRFMPWQFHSWQAYPSINWGYDTYSMNKFTADSKLKGVLSKAGTQYNLLNTVYYDKWVAWRQTQIMNNLNIYKKLLAKNNKNLTLNLQLYGPVYSLNDFQQMSGNLDHNQNDFLQKNDWKPLLQEAGINLDLIATDKNINIGNTFSVPSGLRDRLRDRPVDAAGGYQRQNRDDLVTLFCKKNNTQETCTQNFSNEYLEVNMPLKAIGLAPLNDPNKKFLVAAAAEPSAEHTLEKYTSALYNGNITTLSYGGLGYILGQPDYFKNFSREYLALPATPMQSNKNIPEPIALWYGTYGNKNVLYVVNSAHYPVTLNLLANESIRLQRITSGQVHEGNQISMLLQPYQLLAFEANKSAEKFIRATVSIPLGIDKQFDQQINFVKSLLANNPTAIKNNPALKLRFDKLVQFHANHQYRSMRLSLLAPELIELYTTTKQSPPWLLYDAPPAAYSINTPFTIH